MTANPDISASAHDERIVFANSVPVGGPDQLADPARATGLYTDAMAAGSGAAAERLAVLAAVGGLVARQGGLPLDHRSRSRRTSGRPGQPCRDRLGPARPDANGACGGFSTYRHGCGVGAGARAARADDQAGARSHEPPNFLHYEPGQEYRAHFDFINPGVAGFQKELAMLGQRVATCLVYLNDDFEGGETGFPKIGWKYRGKPGDALLFYNVTSKGQPDASTLHAGLPPTRREKWLLSLWVRDRVQPII